MALRGVGWHVSEWAGPYVSIRYRWYDYWVIHATAADGQYHGNPYQSRQDRDRDRDRIIKVTLQRAAMVQLLLRRVENVCVIYVRTRVLAILIIQGPS